MLSLKHQSAKLDFNQLLFASFLFITSLLISHQIRDTSSYNFHFHSLRSLSHYPYPSPSRPNFFSAFDASIFIYLGSVILFLWSCTAFRRSVVEGDLTPPTVRSYLPWIGSTIPYLRNPAKFFKDNSAIYGPVYRFKIAGQWITTFSSPSFIAAFLRDRSGAFEVIEHQMIPVIAGIRSPKERHPYIYEVVDQKALVALYRGMSARNMSVLAPALSAEIAQQLPGVQGEHSLETFVQTTLYSAVSKALLGRHFPVSNVVEFGHFDAGVPYVLQKRSYMAPRALLARENLVLDWSKFISGHWTEKGLDGASDVVTDIVRTLKNSELTNDEVVRLMTGLFWGTHTNVIRASTWSLSYILTDPHIASLARSEISAAESELTDLQSFMHLDAHSLDHRFPFITSLLKEVLRTKMLPVSVRKTTADTLLQSEDQTILIPKGDIVIADIQSLHHNPNVHSSPEVFKADRFASDEGKDISKTLSFFGGGRHMCAGKHYAMHGMRMFIILLLHLYDIKLAPSSSTALPEVDPSGFTTLVRAANDLTVSISPRC